ncbi:MAG TPA: hypothetical protein VFT00_03195 [Nocardioides sp.]|nr:hypothetical protein [Nocardioides sp.]
MIPTMILLGLVLGRWWKVALVTAAIGWPLLLLANGTDAPADLVSGAALGVANACVGVLAVQVLLHAHLGERLHVHSHAHRTGHRQGPRHLRR